MSSAPTASRKSSSSSTRIRRICPSACVSVGSGNTAEFCFAKLLCSSIVLIASYLVRESSENSGLNIGIQSHTQHTVMLAEPPGLAGSMVLDERGCTQQGLHRTFIHAHQL